MALSLVQAPLGPLFTVPDVRAFLRVEDSENDPVIEDAIADAMAWLDGPSSTLGRAILTQTWDLILDGFPMIDAPFGIGHRMARLAIALPLPPVQDVVSISYIDPNGSTLVMPAEDYRLIKGEPARIVPTAGNTWPSVGGWLGHGYGDGTSGHGTGFEQGGVTVRFTAGYGDDASSVPGALKRAARLLIGHFYETRQLLPPTRGGGLQPFGLEDIVRDYRVLFA